MKRSIIALSVICFILFFLNLQSRDFWAPDEGDFAQIVRELPENFVVPHLNGAPYGEKPPLYYYVIYFSKVIFGSTKDEMSLRFPSGLFALLGVLFLFVTVVKFFDHHKALLSACILISTPLYYWQARYLQVDMIFSVLVSSCLLLFLWFYDVRKVYLLHFAFGCLAMAFLVKGPLAVVLVVPVVLLFLFFEKAFTVVKVRDLIIGCLLCLVVIAPWYGAVYVREGFPYLYENVIRQNFVRFFDAWSHRRPFYYYFTTLPLDFFPWSAFLPLGLYTAFRSIQKDKRILYFLVWFAWMFFFLSLSSGKISKYMLPVLPAIALITSLAFVTEKGPYKRVVVPLLALIFLALGFSLIFVRRDLYGDFYPERLVVGGLALALAVALFFLRTNKTVYVFTAIFAFMVISYTVGNTRVYEKWNRLKSPKVVAEQIRPHVAGGTPWIFYGSIRGVYMYYVGQKAIHVDEHDMDGLRLVASQSDSFFILTKKRDINEVYRALKNVKIVFQEESLTSPMVFLHYAR